MLHIYFFWMMKNCITILFFSLLLISFKISDNIIIDKVQAQNAFTCLNDIRTNPAKYYKDFDFLRTLKMRNTKLVWNDTLAKVAEAKAFDMAQRNYFGHVDPDGYGINYFINKSGYKLDPLWISEKELNYFESIAAGSVNGEDAVKTLIMDMNKPPFGHRNHLLGIDSWNASLNDIGIGYARSDSGSIYDTYVTLIIAKHNW